MKPMLRSMYSSISGMKNFQQKLDVTSNNIANVNTYGFKKGRATFSDLVSQQIAGATGPSDGKGGVNPRQVGLGAQLASVDSIQTQGNLQNTNRELDLGISGDGFFQVTDGEQTYYTRAGNFYLDSEGTIVNANGLKLLDEDGDEIVLEPEDTKSFSIGEDGTVNVVGSDDELDELARIRIVQFANPGGLQKVGGNLYQESANSGDPIEGVPGEDGAGSLVAGTLEMSNVDLSEEFTEMIVAQRGFQANTRGITTSDEILQELMNLKR